MTRLAFNPRPSFSSYLLGAVAMLVIAGVVEYVLFGLMMGAP